MNKFFLLIAVICSLLLSGGELRAASSGKCGDNITWTLDDNGLLTLTGSGKMYDYGCEFIPRPGASTPWLHAYKTIKKISIGNGITYIGTCAFAECGSAKEVNIPASITHIGEHAFYECDSCNVNIYDLTAWCNINFDDSSANPLTFEGGGLYINGTSVVDLVIPSSIRQIKASTFASCTSLKSVVMPNVTEIGNNAFSGCSNLTTVNAPNASKIGGGSFSYCSLTTVDLPNAYEIGDGAFSGCDSLTTVNAPNASEIGGAAFRYCENLTIVNLPNASKIGDYAFSNCESLTTADFPNASEIGDGAFLRLQQFNGCRLT